MDGDEPPLEPGPSSVLPPEPGPGGPPPLPKGGGAPPPLPPKLPPRSTGARPASVTAPTPVPKGPTHARTPTATPMAAPVGNVPSSLPQIPIAVPRPDGDPFGEPPEARPPRSGSPDEKVEFFRQVVKQKSETLTRARQVYAERDAEAEQLRTLSTQLRGQLETALAQITPLRDLPERYNQAATQLEAERARADKAESELNALKEEFAAVEADRKDAARALFDVEAQLPLLNEKLQKEIAAKVEVQEELDGIKQALSLAQDRVSEVAAQKSEAEGNAQALNEQYQNVVQELEHAQSEVGRLGGELERVSEEAKTLQAE